MRALFVLPAAAIVLTSCAIKSNLAPDEVLLRSTQANSELSSARFHLEADIEQPDERGEMSETQVEADGVMQNGGQQLEMEVTAEGGNAEDGPWEINANIVVAGEGEVYVKLNSFAQAPREIIGTWWLLPSKMSAPIPVDVTPDPGMLRMQTEVIDVVKDNGIVSLNGHRVHHYEVAVNKEKLAAFLSNVDSADPQDLMIAGSAEATVTGEIWIDAETYVLRRADWKTENASMDDSGDMELSVTISDHNSGITVSPPSSAQPLPIESLFPMLPIAPPTLP